MEVGYKVFRAEVLKGIELKSQRFGFEPEITMKLAKKALPLLRSADLLSWPHLRRGQEDHLERRRRGAVLHAAIQILRLSGRSKKCGRSMPRPYRLSVFLLLLSSRSLVPQFIHVILERFLEWELWRVAELGLADADIHRNAAALVGGAAAADLHFQFGRDFAHYLS